MSRTALHRHRPLPLPACAQDSCPSICERYRPCCPERLLQNQSWGCQRAGWKLGSRASSHAIALGKCDYKKVLWEGRIMTVMHSWMYSRLEQKASYTQMGNHVQSKLKIPPRAARNCRLLSKPSYRFSVTAHLLLWRAVPKELSFSVNSPILSATVLLRESELKLSSGRAGTQSSTSLSTSALISNT